MCGLAVWKWEPDCRLPSWPLWPKGTWPLLNTCQPKRISLRGSWPCNPAQPKHPAWPLQAAAAFSSRLLLPRSVWPYPNPTLSWPQHYLLICKLGIMGLYATWRLNWTRQVPACSRIWLYGQGSSMALPCPGSMYHHIHLLPGLPAACPGHGWSRGAVRIVKVGEDH